MLLMKQKIEEYLDINLITRYPNWSSTTTYNFGDIVFDDHYYYRSVIDENLNLLPSENMNEWLRWDISNRYAQIDMRATTETVCNIDTIEGGVGPYTLISEFQNDRYDALALGYVNAEYVFVEILSNLGTPVWTFTENLGRVRPEVVNWYTYYYTPIPSTEDDYPENFFIRLPNYSPDYSIRVTLGERNGYSSCGYMLCGNSKYIGDSLYGLNRGLEDFSIKEVDSFGILELTKRQSRQIQDVDVLISSGRIETVTRDVRDHLGEVILMITDESTDTAYEHLLMLCTIDDFNVILSNAVKVEASLSVSEVI